MLRDHADGRREIAVLSIAGAILGGKPLVISPLIALMQDQVAQLAQMGIPAALLNSSLAAGEQSRVMRKARAGDYRLLYHFAGTPGAGRTRRVAAGRPDLVLRHRRSALHLGVGPRVSPGIPPVELPAGPFSRTAHRRLHRQRHTAGAARHHSSAPDARPAQIHRQLSPAESALRGGGSATGDRRPAARERAAQLTRTETSSCTRPPSRRWKRRWISWRAGNSPRSPYHGQMEAGERRRNQERWMSDEVRVLVGTIAFGLGINKAAVRAVIHLSLPKSIEQYYQEAGRAGRDGLPADCVLLWQKRDAGMLAHFIQTDRRSGREASGPGSVITRFADSSNRQPAGICRSAVILARRPSGRRAKCAMCAARSRNG